MTAARAGKRTGLRLLRMTAINSAMTRMIGSAMRKILTLSMNPSSTLGNDSVKSDQLKKASRTDAQPVEPPIRKASPPKKTTELTRAIAAERRTSGRVQADFGASSSAISASVNSRGAASCVNHRTLNLRVVRSRHRRSLCAVAGHDRGLRTPRARGP